MSDDDNLVLGALDTLGVALANYDHSWTVGERTIYEEAVAMLTSRVDSNELLGVGPYSKVICVDDTNFNPTHRRPKGGIVKGHLYHVTAIRHDNKGFRILGKPTIGRTGSEGFWAAYRFRPVGRTEVT